MGINTKLFLPVEGTSSCACVLQFFPSSCRFFPHATLQTTLYGSLILMDTMGMFSCTFRHKDLFLDLNCDR